MPYFVPPTLFKYCPHIALLPHENSSLHNNTIGRRCTTRQRQRYIIEEFPAQPVLDAKLCAVCSFAGVYVDLVVLWEAVVDHWVAGW